MKIIFSTMADDGGSLVAIETPGSVDGYRLRTWKTLQLLKVPDGVICKAGNIEGAKVLRQHDFDARDSAQSGLALHVLGQWMELGADVRTAEQATAEA